MARKKKQATEDIIEQFKHPGKIVEEVELGNYVKDNFLPYAYSVVLDRALTDVSGLKPVQKRILYSMWRNGITDKSARQKVTRCVGNVLLFHPHGDSSVESALTNLAVPDIFRVPLIDGKGSFGGVGPYGSAAAGRYIEARLTTPAMLLLDGIPDHAVKMIPNYDDTTEEPSRLPVKWPVAIINGSSGIAVGYACNMVSHNPNEVMKACSELVKNPEMTVRRLMKIMPGPDFNMGGTILSNDGIKDYMTTGKGSFKIRGKYNLTPGKRGKYSIEFYEIPTGVWPEKIIEEIQKKQLTGQLKDVSEYKNLSDLKHPTRLVIETKPGANVQAIITQLFKMTSLESNVSVNMTTIVDNKPQLVGMIPLLKEFIEFRKDCITNTLNFSKGKKEERLHLLDGILAILLDIDKAIKIIRNSNSAITAKDNLKKSFKIDDIQADYILSMQLRRLTKQDSHEIQQEKKDITSDIKNIKTILSNKDKFNEYMIDEFKETAKVLSKFNLQAGVYTTQRKTDIQNKTSEEVAEENKILIQQAKANEKNVPVFLTRFADGRLMETAKEFSYRDGSSLLDHGPIIEEIKMMSKDYFVAIGSDGLGRKTPMSYMRKDSPMTVSEIGIKLPNGVRLVGIAKYDASTSDIGIAIGTKNGEGKIANTSFPKNSEEFSVITLKDGDEVVNTRWLGRTLTGSVFAVVSSDANILTFDATSLRVAGPQSGGVNIMKLSSGSDVVYFDWIQNYKDSDNLVVSKTGKTIKLTALSDISVKGRGGKGMILQEIRKEKSPLDSVIIGKNAAVSLKRVHKVVSLPPLTARARTGAQFALSAEFGHTKVISM